MNKLLTSPFNNNCHCGTLHIGQLCNGKKVHLNKISVLCHWSSGEENVKGKTSVPTRGFQPLRDNIFFKYLNVECPTAITDGLPDILTIEKKFSNI